MRNTCACGFSIAASSTAQQAGWTPTWTLTEDFALGMEMKRYGWHCRYLNKYLAVGEAPDGVRNCYQQRSRWTKVQLQTHKPSTRGRAGLASTSTARSVAVSPLLILLCLGNYMARWRGGVRIDASHWHRGIQQRRQKICYC